MTFEDLVDRLRRETVVPLTAAEWGEVGPEFEVVERHPTFLAGELLVVRGAGALFAVEAPSTAERTVRRLADDEAMRRFVRERLDTYERMWDGCGCKVDYYR
jgi:hypothetical protein